MRSQDKSPYDQYMESTLSDCWWILPNEAAKKLSPHGTVVNLTVKRSAELPDVLKTAKKWIVIPDCDVFVTIDNNPVVKIGYTSPKEALEQIIQDSSDVNRKKNERVVVQQEIDGVTTAFALEWSQYFHYWNFIRAESLSNISDVMLGTCVRGYSC